MSRPQNVMVKRRAAVLPYLVRPHTADEIAAEFKISVATVYNTIKAIEELGIEISRLARLRKNVRGRSVYFVLNVPLENATALALQGVEEPKAKPEKKVQVKPVSVLAVAPTDKKRGPRKEYKARELVGDQGAAWFIITPDRRASYRRIEEDRIERCAAN